MKTLRTVLLALTASLTLALSVATQAATIKLTYQNNLLDDSSGRVYSKTGTSLFLGTRYRSHSTKAGEFDFTTSHNTTDIAQWDDGLSAFCIELDTSLRHQPTTYQVSSGLGGYANGSTGTYIDRLFSTFYEDSQSSSLNSTAFQLALWEITNEGADTFDLTKQGGYWSGHDFHTNSFNGAQAQAQQWLNALDGDNVQSGLYEFHTLTSHQSQNLLAVTKTSVPEPGTLLLLATGLFALLRARRRVS